MVEFTYNNSYQASIQMTSYEALYGRPCRSPVCWTEVGERSTTGPELIRVTSEKVDLIQKLLLTAQSQQKSYADTRRRPLEFEVGDHVFLKVMPKRGVIKFGKRGKLSPRYIGPLEVDRRKAWCIKYTPICASARVAPSSIVYSWYRYRSTGTGVLTTKVLLFR